MRGSHLGLKGKCYWWKHGSACTVDTGQEDVIHTTLLLIRWNICSQWYLPLMVERERESLVTAASLHLGQG